MPGGGVAKIVNDQMWRTALSFIAQGNQCGVLDGTSVL